MAKIVQYFSYGKIVKGGEWEKHKISIQCMQGDQGAKKRLLEP